MKYKFASTHRWTMQRSLKSMMPILLSNIFLKKSNNDNKLGSISC